jgi:2-dehydro-3-deoxy-D-arabinonate dehydratase
MLLYRTSRGPVLHADDQWRHIDREWTELVNDDRLHEALTSATRSLPADANLAALAIAPLAPIGPQQELWAAGVTYMRSRTARMEESETAGGGDFYDRVYRAERPELFLKATPHRIVGAGAALHLRSDSRWMVPEPELVLVVTRTGRIVGYTIGNDLSCRDIEGENPLYLPQAKTYDRCAALGPAILVAASPPPPETCIRISVSRAGRTVVEGATTLAKMKRKPEELVGYLFRDNTLPHGCLLMTGTGVVPPDEFSLEEGDAIEISIDGIGALRNTVDR